MECKMNNIDLKFIILWVIVIIVIYRTYFKRIGTYKEYINRSISYKMIFNPKKAIRILKDALEKGEFSKEDRYGLLISISKIYYSLKDYAKATIYFERALDLIQDEKFKFNVYYIKMIKCYVDSNQKQKAIDIYDNLESRKSYDKSFEKLHSIKSLL